MMKLGESQRSTFSPEKKNLREPLPNFKVLGESVNIFSNYSNKSNIEKVDQVTRVGSPKVSLSNPCWCHQPSRFWVSLTPCCVDQSHHSNQGPPWKADGRPQNGRRRKGCAYRLGSFFLRKNHLPNVKVAVFSQTVDFKTVHVGRRGWVLLNLGEMFNNSKCKCLVFLCACSSSPFAQSTFFLRELILNP